MGLVDKGRSPKALTWLLNYGRKRSMWVYQWGLACCAIEMGAAFASPRYDVMRLGVIPLLGRKLGIEQQEVIRVCVQEGVPIYQGKIDKYLFQAQLQAIGASQPQT